MAKATVRTEQLEDDEFVEQEEPKIQRRGKDLDSKKKGIRVLTDAPIRTSRPVSVYKERVVDVDGTPRDMIWYTTEDSKVIGKEEITKFNPKTERESTLGFDYQIEYDKTEFDKIYKQRFGMTKFYHKDGEETIYIANPEKDF